MPNIVDLYQCYIAISTLEQHVSKSLFLAALTGLQKPKKSMESSDQYNFSIFNPRNLHGRKNRNVILTMLAIWAVAVFGFQVLLRVIEKPVPEKALIDFQANWPYVTGDEDGKADYQVILNSLLLVKGKITVSDADKLLLSDAISNVTFMLLPDSVKQPAAQLVREIDAMKDSLAGLDGQEFLDMRSHIQQTKILLITMTEPYTGLDKSGLEASILAPSLKADYPPLLTDASFNRLPEVMELYLIHNRSVLTDTRFLGFPFHYFYTAVLLLILFVILCIVYNILIEWRLKKEGIVE
jgi:uncharacterized membrane protein